MSPSPRAEARAAGNTTYTGGKPCRRGHGDARYTVSGTCVECCNASTRPERPERRRERLYGLNPTAFTALLQAQDGKCAVCNAPMVNGSPRGDGLAVDHCHHTRRVRGLLCMNCNKGLGLFKDSPALLRAAISYLSQHGNLQEPRAD